MSRITVISCCLALSLISLGFSDESDEFGGTLVEMSKADYRSYIKGASPLDRLSCDSDSCYFLVSDDELDILNTSGFDFVLLSFPNSFGITQNKVGVDHNTKNQGDINGPYHNYLEAETLLTELATEFPQLARLSIVGRSIEGRNIYAIKISDSVDVNEDPMEPNVFYFGCHHAREWISVEVPLLYAQYLLENYATNTEVREIVDSAQIFIMPVMNPDGLEFSIHTYRWWRKNRRYLGNWNWGVDPNRNYGYQWGYDDEGSSPNPSSATFRGASAFSEPEAQAVRDLLLAHPPAVSASYHNYSQIIIYPWGFSEVPTPDDALMYEIASEMSARMLAVSGRLYEIGSGSTLLYHTNGGFTDWVYQTFGTPAYTIELPNDDYPSGGFFTSVEEIEITFNENLPAMMYLAQFAISRETIAESPSRTRRVGRAR